MIDDMPIIGSVLLIIAAITIGVVLTVREVKEDNRLNAKCSKEIIAKNLSEECVGYLINKGQSHRLLPIPVIIPR